MVHITVDPSNNLGPLKGKSELPRNAMPGAKEVKAHPDLSKTGQENASIFFVGTATTVLEWAGIRLMTDPK